MKLFACDVCGNLLHFENTRCEACGAALGYLPDKAQLSALQEEDGQLLALADGKRAYLHCANATFDSCNWMVSADSHAEYCSACANNRVVPDLSNPANQLLWRRVQFALHRLIYTLDRMQLPHPVRDKGADAGGLVFDVLADPDDPAAPRVMTGHDEGLITLALAEADDAEREKRRAAMGEPYRTLLGHFRHEVGHYYWNLLVRDAGRLEECRAVFGDERPDYNAALQAHYAKGADDSWRGQFISSYAAAHPWEDWAESWAHYMHIQDSLEMAAAFGLGVRPRLDPTGELTGRIGFNPYTQKDYARIVEAWLPVTIAMNGMNRCMGTSDLYPFVMSDAVVAKLRYIHGLVLQQSTTKTAREGGRTTPKRD
jgi:hypothetical protein